VDSPLADPLLMQLPVSKMFLPHCGCMVTLRHVKKLLVCPEAAGALTTTPKCHVDKSPSYACAVL
jgi:hypothetical protein